MNSEIVQAFLAMVQFDFLLKKAHIVPIFFLTANPWVGWSINYLLLGTKCKFPLDQAEVQQ